MSLSTPFIERPVATTLLTIGLALSGLFAFGYKGLHNLVFGKRDSAGLSKLPGRDFIQQFYERRDSGALHVVAPVLGVLHRSPIVHDARSDRRFAHRVADVEAFDALDRAFGPKPLLQRRHPCLLGRLRGEALAARQRGVATRHLEPRARFPVRMRDDLDGTPRDLGQHRLELTRVRALVAHDLARNRLRGVVLREERLDHRCGIAPRGVLREEAAIT